MESAVSRKSKNYVDDDIDAIPEGHDRAIAIESRRRDTAYHLNRYLEKHTRHSVAPSASLRMFFAGRTRCFTTHEALSTG